MNRFAFVALCCVVVSLSAQQSTPKFEVASVKPNQSGELAARLGPSPDGSFTSSNVPLRALIEFAYQLPPERIVGIPDWAMNTRYDIAAKAGDTSLPSEQAGLARSTLRLRSLLADRFRLTVHNDTRDLPIYELRLARVGGGLGPQLVQSNRTECQAMRNTFSNGRRTAVPTVSATDNRLGCGVRIGLGYIVGGDIPLSEFAEGLSRVVQRNVMDRTGLTGSFDAELTFNPEQQQLPFPLPPGIAAVDPNAPSIFAAIQEQLGLRLDPARGPVEVLVIDSVERPTPD